MKKKCLRILYYAIEVCPLNKAHINFLDFAVGSCFSKIFVLNHEKQFQSVCGCLTVSLLKMLLIKEGKIS